MRRELAALIAICTAGCPTTNTPPDAFMRDAGPPDPGSSTNCRAVDVLPSGTYWVGTDSTNGDVLYLNRPAHEVQLTRDAWVTRYESSFACYRACVDAGECPELSPLYGPTSRLRDRAYSRLPASGIALDAAASYCDWLGGRLLSGAEWESLTRGPDGRRFPWDEPPADPRNPEAGPRTPSEVTCARANWNQAGMVCTSTGLDLSPIDSHPDGRGPFGHFNLVANAGEWVTGTLHQYPAAPQVDPMVDDGSGMHLARMTTLNQGGGEGAATARCLFTSPPEPLYVEE